MLKTESTEEPNHDSNEAVTKLMVDRPSDFRFHAAYLAYSKTWDRTTSQITKTKLNEIMLSLSNETISYSSFYKKLYQYRRYNSQYHTKKRIETQRKREWRKRQARDARNARHKGRH